MEFLTELWLPIVVSAVFVFIVSSIVHMVLPIHRADFKKLTGETDILAEMRKQGLTPGDYMFPCPASMKDMASPEMMAKFEQGPVGWMHVLPSGSMAIGKSLIQWFVFSLFVGVLVAYAARIGVAPGASGVLVFRVTAVLAFMSYGVGIIPNSIWKGHRWLMTFKFVFDGLLYGLATGAAFAWLWPEA